MTQATRKKSEFSQQESNLCPSVLFGYFLSCALMPANTCLCFGCSFGLLSSFFRLSPITIFLFSLSFSKNVSVRQLGAKVILPSASATVVHCAHIAKWASFWCKNDVITGTGNHVFLGGGNRWPVGKKESRAHGTGSDVVWKGKPRTSWKKGIVGSGKSNRGENGGHPCKQHKKKMK